MEIHRNEYQEKELVEIARRKVKKLKGFYIHAFIYLIGVLVFILKEYFGVPFNFFPLKHINFFALAIWSSIFFISAIDMLITYHFFGENWEERKIKRIMEKESKKQNWK
ncbi:hypothetical protein DB891_03310 [Flavobacterium laiguense]|uniref:2TM domain-containing protein n=2 Tax=Flavobacterium laiguense TaxID=2169409 RepID=A0A2U1K1M8_9FLAO|nr:hypothetical protein DB891_03310 [Flavobacterium laiguense]